MENTAPNFSEKLHASLKKSIPDSATFSEYIKPFFISEQENYEKYLRILKKIGIENDITGVIELITGTADASLKETDKAAQALNSEVDKKYKDKPIPPTEQGVYDDLQDL